MKEKVMSLAQGNFAYEQPEIVVSPERLEFEVPEGGEAAGVFHVRNAANTKIKGFSAVDEFDIGFLPVFDGKDNEITVNAHAGTRKPGDVLEGTITVITDCGEHALPYRITVTGRYLQGVTGEVQSYAAFVRYAQEHFEEAVSLFYHNKFCKLYLSEMGDKRLYQYLTKKNSKKQALEEFLAARGDKKTVQFMVNKKQLVYRVEEEDVSGEILVVKDGWGMTGIRLESDRAFLTLDKDHLQNPDFSDDQASISFRIHAASVPPGRHRCRIVLENVYQRLEVAVRVHGAKGAEQRKKRLAGKKLTAALVHGHIRYMLNSSYKESWVSLLTSEKERIVELCGGDSMVYEGYVSYMTKNEVGMNLFRAAVDGLESPKTGDSADKVYRYLLFSYLKVKMGGSEEEREELITRLKFFYGSGYRHWRLLVLLERLGCYEGDAVGFIEELDTLWEEGYSSPYLHLYRVMLILQEPDLLKRLDEKTTGALQFALKHDLMTGHLVIAVSFLASRKKRCTPALFKLLTRCYDMYGNKDTLQSICALLIRSEKQGPRYFKWFQLGVEQSLRLTDLFEYYMYSMKKEDMDQALATVISFFKYENHLRDPVKTSFYASIVRNRDEHPQYFEAYESIIWEFALGQLHSRKISAELALLYEACLTPGEIRGQAALDLPYILFTHHVTCKNRNMERVVVVHDEGGGATKYNLVNGEAWVSIGTPHARLYFEDKRGFYHTGTVPYEMEKLLALDFLAETCYENGSDHPVLLLHLFSRAVEKKETSARDAIILHTMIRKDIPGEEYRCQALLVLYEYYRSIGEDKLLEEVIRSIPFPYVEEEKQIGILQTMIQHRMNDEALEVLRKYRLTSASKKLILLLITWKLEENNGKFQTYHMRLCDFLYRNGVSNEKTLSYLADYYVGSTAHLRDIYRDAVKRQAIADDGATERLLGQALFVSDDPEKYADIFLDYYEYGANRMLAKAFLLHWTYRYLVGTCGMFDGARKLIQKKGLSEENEAVVLAMLKYYSQKEAYTEAEREYIGYHLSQCVSKGQVLDFMTQFVGKIEVPFEIENSGIVQCCTSSPGDVYIELDEPGGTAAYPMRQVFTDIYVFETLLFRGERIPYRVYAGSAPEPAVQGVLEKERKEGASDSAFYGLVEQMLAARERGDKQEFDRLVARYKSRHQMAEALLKPMEEER